MRKKINPIFENIEITALAAEGKALAKIDEKVVFIPYGAVGDVVDIEIFRKKKHYMEGRILRFHAHSPLRQESFCEHFGLCGGCKWQHIVYPEQLRQKQEQVYDHLSRIGKLDFPQIQEILPSKKTQYYRNKLEYTFSPKRWLTQEEVNQAEDLEYKDRAGLGFHLAGMFDKVLDIQHCYLQADPSNEIRLALKSFALSQDYSFYNVREHVGLLRNLMIRSNRKGEYMVVVIFGENQLDPIEKILTFLSEKFSQIVSLQYVINEKYNDSMQGLDPLLYKGSSYLFEEMEVYKPIVKIPSNVLRFRISAKSFYQTNADQAGLLYRLALDFAELKGDEVVYDLYTGTGTIALFTAPYVKKVVGIEYVEEAVADAFENARLNGIENVSFYAGDMAKVLTDEFVNQNGMPDVLITDPPREGMHPDVCAQILRMKPEKIVYVSCNSATQARDLAILCEEVYEIIQVRPVDMFPHTYHVENVVALKRK